MQVWSSSERWGKSASYCSRPSFCSLYQVQLPSLSPSLFLSGIPRSEATLPHWDSSPRCHHVFLCGSRALLCVWAALLTQGEDRRTWGGSRHDIMKCFGSARAVEPRDWCRNASILKSDVHMFVIAPMVWTPLSVQQMAPTFIFRECLMFICGGSPEKPLNLSQIVWYLEG